MSGVSIHGPGKVGPVDWLERTLADAHGVRGSHGTHER